MEKKQGEEKLGGEALEGDVESEQSQGERFEPAKVEHHHVSYNFDILRSYNQKMSLRALFCMILGKK